MYSFSLAKKFNNVAKVIFFLEIFLFITPNLIFSQTNNQQKRKRPDPTAHHEVKDDDYIPVSEDDSGKIASL